MNNLLIKNGLLIHADLLIINPKASTQGWEINLDTILDWNAYTGLPAIFPETVIRRGEVVVASGQTQTCSQGKLVVSTPS